MKKKLTILLLILCALFVAGCSKQTTSNRLETPLNVQIETANNSTWVSFDAVENARSYNIKIDNFEIDTYSTRYNISAFLTQNRNYTILVRALGFENFLNSNFSPPVIYANSDTLAVPVVNVIDKTLTWTQIGKADKYTISFTSPETATQYCIDVKANQFNFSDYLLEAGKYNFNVTAQSDNAFVYASEASEFVFFDNPIKLSAPISVNVNKKENDVILSYLLQKPSSAFLVKIDNLSFYFTSEKSHFGQINLSQIYNFEQARQYAISFTDLGQGAYISSDPIIKYYSHRLQLPAPVVTEIVASDGNYIIKWSFNSEIATTYEVYINNIKYHNSISGNSCTIADADGKFYVSIRAKGTGLYDASDLSQQTYYGYSQILLTPQNLHINNRLLSFDQVAVATGYRIKINDNIFVAPDNSIDITPYLETAGEYNIQVKALGSGSNADSEYCEVYKYYHYNILPTPQLELNAQDKLLTFDQNPSAKAYALYINDKLVNSNIDSGEGYLKYFLTSGSQKIKIMALADSSTYTLNSAFSNEITIDVALKLNAVANGALAQDDGRFYLSFDKVDFADYYSISINNFRFDTMDNYIDVSDYVYKAGKFTVKIQSVANLLKSFEKSDFAQFEYDYYVYLDQVTDFSIEETGGRHFAVFTPIHYATGYQLEIEGVTHKLNITASGEDITEFLQVGLNSVKITPFADEYHIKPNASETYATARYKQLDLVDLSQISIVKNGENITVSWQSVANAAAYKIFLDDVEIIERLESASFNLANYIDKETTYIITIQTLGSGYYLDSQTASKNYTHQWTNLHDYNRYEVFMYGKLHSSYIQNYAQFEAVIWHQFLFRENKIKIYLGVSAKQLTNGFNSQYATSFDQQSLSNLIILALSKYPEYMLTQTINSVTTEKITNETYKISITNHMPSDCTENYDIENYKTNSHLSAAEIEYLLGIKNPSNHSAQIIKTYNTRSSDYDDFAINALTGIEVYNTEQLFMAAQYGMRPIINDAESVVATVYENAKIILREIITDTMTQIQKISAIYEWIQKQNVYDYEQLEYAIKRGGYVDVVGYFNVYYLEGILYDLQNSYAVCDGIAKTFALLCRIEGIQAIKINGLANGGRHAWNKIKLQDNWYLVDATWSDSRPSYQGEMQDCEVMSYDFFMVADSNLTTHQQQWPKLQDTQALSNYNYFQKTFFTDDEGHQISLSATSSEQLAKILIYLTNDYKVGNADGYVIHFEVDRLNYDGNFVFTFIDEILNMIDLPSHTFYRTSYYINSKIIFTIFTPHID